MEVLVPSQESERSYRCVRVIEFWSVNDFLGEFWNSSDGVVLLLFILLFVSHVHIEIYINLFPWNYGFVRKYA